MGNRNHEQNISNIYDSMKVLVFTGKYVSGDKKWRTNSENTLEILISLLNIC